MNIQIVKKQAPSSGAEKVSIFHKRKIHIETRKELELNKCALNLLNSKTMVSVFESKYGDLHHKSIFVLRVSYELSIYKKQATIVDLNKRTSISRKMTCPFAFANDVSKSYRDSISNLNSYLESESGYKGGLIGYLGYGLTELSLDIERQKKSFIKIPDAIMFIPGCFVEIDHLTKQVKIVSDQTIDECNSVIELMQIKIPIKTTSKKLSSKVSSAVELQTCSIAKADFIKKVSQIKEHIKSGNAFQIVLSNRISVQIPTTALELYKEVASSSQSMYNYFFDFGEFQYLGSSPESFILVDDKNVSFKALAGTRPRGVTTLEDKIQQEELINCPKENAEHMMLVDLGRNDLGRVCQPGSVQVRTLKDIVKNSNVMHLSSEIYGYLKENKNVFDAIKSCFPRGTVSGAPKRRALNILSKLETEQRGIYSGCIGFIDIKDNANLAIAIRGATIDGRTAHIQSGAGIVYDSVPNLEYLETIHKANSILKPLERLKQ